MYRDLPSSMHWLGNLSCLHLKEFTNIKCFLLKSISSLSVIDSMSWRKAASRVKGGYAIFNYNLHIIMDFGM